ncbi:MAG: hypothetical protein ACLR76_04550 [Alistipes sp.]
MTKEYIVIAFTENQIGVLNRITALYLRRKINIESLKVSESSIGVSACSSSRPSRPARRSTSSSNSFATSST